MANVLISTENISHKDWLAARRLGLGGSDASVVCGINRWKTPIELYMEKLEILPPREAGEAAYWGNRLEDLVKEEFTLRTGIEVIPICAILQHKDYPFMLANLDGICYHPDYGDVVFEAKTTGAYRSGEWIDENTHENGNGIPPEYILQLQHYMAVTGFKGAYIAVLIGGNNFKWYFVERDEELISMLIKLEQEFWDRVQSGIPPELDGSEASAKFLNRHFPNSIPESLIQLPDTAMSLVEQYNQASDKIKHYSELKQEAENLMKQMLGDNEVGIIGRAGFSGGVGISGKIGISGRIGISGGDKNVDGFEIDCFGVTDDNSNLNPMERSDRIGGKVIITWKSFTQERLDTKAIKSEHPTLCKRYLNTITSRRFSVKSAS